MEFKKIKTITNSKTQLMLLLTPSSQGCIQDGLVLETALGWWKN